MPQIEQLRKPELMFGLSRCQVQMTNERTYLWPRTCILNHLSLLFSFVTRDDPRACEISFSERIYDVSG